MRGSIGQLLISQGAIDAAALSDALARQAGRHPVASELYVLGHASEHQLCAALAMQSGWPAVVFDESTLQLDVLEHVSAEWARIFSALVIAEDAHTLVIAATRPEDAIVPARELGNARGKRVELRIALDVTLARTIRVAFRKWKDGEQYLVGSEARPGGPHLEVVSPGGAEDESLEAQRVLALDAARGLDGAVELPSDELAGASMSLTGDWNVSTVTTTSDDDALAEERTGLIAADLDRLGEALPREDGRRRALVVDPDADGRIQLVAELERLGWECQAAAGGTQAIDLLGHLVFDMVFADVATPEVDGLQLCRALKRSRRLARARVVVTTSVIDSGQVPDDVLRSHGADGYLEKPLDMRRLHRILRELGPDPHQGHEAVVADAIARYHAGDVDGAIGRLRGALAGDPANAKLRFMLANMLQRMSRWPEAVDEYEAVVELQPAYFPALTRLAYLYFRQGLHARAVETWRRALPVCDDPALRKNIELFMRKLVTEMNEADAR